MDYTRKGNQDDFSFYKNISHSTTQRTESSKIICMIQILLINL